MGQNDEKIRARAYDIWDRDGRPHGRDEEYWLQAERELNASQGANQAAVTAGATPTREMVGDTVLSSEAASTSEAVPAPAKKKANGSAKAVAAKAAAPRKRRGAQPQSQA